MLQNDLNYILSSSIDWKKFANKTILITGANGFLPAYMVETLLALNKTILKETPCNVLALVRNKKHTEQRFYSYLNNKYLTFMIQDVTKTIKIKQNLDYIIHAASLASPKYYNIDPVGVILPNVLGTKNILELAIKKEINSFLFFSSGEVYGENPDGETIKENSFGYLDPTSVRACYGESKRMGENLCVNYGHQYSIPVKIVRPFHTYGPGMKLDDGRVFADFVKNIVNNQNIQLKSAGKAIRPFCYLSDATIAFFKVLLDGHNNNAYNVANPNETTSIKKLAELLVDLFPEKKLKVTSVEQDTNYLQSSIKGHHVDISKLKILGWKPKITLKEGFKKTIESYL